MWFHLKIAVNVRINIAACIIALAVLLNILR
jgi:hypothetical protein